MNDPAFLFYSKDWLTGTSEFSLVEKGAYITLLAHQHQNNGIPNNIEKLARIVGISVQDFGPIWSGISSKFIQNGDRLFNKKLTRETIRREDFTKKKAILGIFGAIIKKIKQPKEVIDFLKKDFDYQEFINYNDQELRANLQAKLEAKLQAFIGTATGTATGTIISSSLEESEKPLNEKSDLSRLEYEKNVFRTFWNQYPGTKGELSPEFRNFVQHNDFADAVQELMPALDREKLWRIQKNKAGENVPEWKNLENWIKKRCWRQTLAEVSDKPATKAEASRDLISQVAKEKLEKWNKSLQNDSNSNQVQPLEIGTGN